MYCKVIFRNYNEYCIIFNLKYYIYTNVIRVGKHYKIDSTLINNYLLYGVEISTGVLSIQPFLDSVLKKKKNPPVNYYFIIVVLDLIQVLFYKVRVRCVKAVKALYLKIWSKLMAFKKMHI